jgi:hypothetical protein
MADHQAFVDARNAKLSANTRKLFAEFDEILTDVLTVKNDALPEAFRNGSTADKTTTMASLVKKTTPKAKPVRELRSESVKFETVNGERVITEFNPARLAAIENYRKQAEAGAETLTYDVDDYNHYNAMMTFAKVMVSAGILSEDDFTED